jgi:hypothetical protein
MKDLEILNKQLRDATRKLKDAQKAKKIRQDTLTNLELQMQQLKHTLGQKRAQQNRMNELLGQGQRALAVAQQDAKKGRRDLDDVDHQVCVFLETKRRILAASRRHERKMDNAQAKSKLCHDMAREAHDYLQHLQEQRNKILQEEEMLYAAAEQEVSQSQILAQELVESRAASSDVEARIDVSLKEQTKLVGLEDGIKQQIADDDAKNQLDMEAMEKEIASYRSAMEDCIRQGQAKQAELSQANDNLRQSWMAVLGIQVAEGHSPSKDPTESNEPPTLDLARISDTVNAEDKAATSEAAAKDDLQVETDLLQKDLVKHQVQVNEKSKHAQALEQDCREQLGKETERQEYWETFLVSYEQAQAEVVQ